MEKPCIYHYLIHIFNGYLSVYSNYDLYYRLPCRGRITIIRQYLSSIAHLDAAPSCDTCTIVVSDYTVITTRERDEHIHTTPIKYDTRLQDDSGY